MQKTDFMKEIEITSPSLFYIVEKLKEEFVGGYINSVQLIDGEEPLFKFKIHKQKTKELIISLKTIFICEHVLPVNPLSNGLIKFLKRKLDNQRIQEIYQDKNNRVICLRLDDYNLIFEFFSKSNIILTDLEFNVITSKQKEEWKDRIIKKNEKYLFPQNKDIKEVDIKQLIDETKDFDLKQTISYLVKEYNTYPGYLVGDTKEEVVKRLKEIYSFNNPLLYLEEKGEKEIVVVRENEQVIDNYKFFEAISKHYIENIKIDNVKEEVTKTKKQNSILESQEKTKEEYLEIASNLQKEGEAIYSYFQTIDRVNEQIRIARDKKIADAEIIEKLNLYFSKNQKELKVTKIDLKNKTYTLEIIE